MLRQRVRARGIRVVGTGFKWQEPSQPFQLESLFERQRVRLILDTKGERVAGEKKRITAKGFMHSGTGRPPSEPELIEAGDTEKLVNTLENIHTVPRDT